ncbi:MAG: hypothetical protein AB7T48_03630 [Solirubrobacterales bacterium]
MLTLPAAAPAFAAEAGAAAEVPGSSPEAPETTTEPTPAPSTGWVPQEGSGGTAGGGEKTSRGSTLGSGGSSKPTPSATPAPAPAPTPSPSTYQEEPETESTLSLEETVETAPVEAAPTPAEEPATKPAPDKPSLKAVGGAVVVASAKPRQGVLGASAESAPVAAVPAAASSDPGSSGIGTAGLAALVVCLLALVYAGARVMLGPVEPNLSGRLWSRSRR